MRKVIKAVESRLRILFFFFSKREVRRRVRITDVIANMLTSKCEKIAEKLSAQVGADGKYKKFKIEGFSDVFNYPATAPYHNFAQVVVEGLIQKHWHYYEIPQTSVNKNDIIVDCGSAEGFFAFKYQNLAKHIYTIEPLPLFVDSLNSMFANKDNITILPYALSSTRGKLYMEINDSAIASTCSTNADEMENFIEVSAFPIDDLFEDKKITYLKADLEGYEEEMIKGALKTIKNNKPKIAITTYHTGQDYKKLIELIRSVVPEYKYLLKGVEYRVGNPVMLHMWVE